MRKKASYSVTIEWLRPDVGIARVHPHAGGVHGDPFVWCCVVERSGECAIIRAVSAPIPLSAAREFGAELYRQGFRRRRHVRLARSKTGGYVEEQWAEINPPREATA